MMKEFLLDRTNWLVMIVWLVAALGFSIWQMLWHGSYLNLSIILMSVPMALLGLCSLFVLYRL